MRESQRRAQAKYRAKPENKKRQAQYNAKYNAKPENQQRKSEYYAQYNARPDNKQRRAEQQRFRKYDLTPLEYTFMLAGQQFRCAICGTDDPSAKGWHVDHCHDTGEVRGILCNGCNLGIGKLGDNAAGVRTALAYLERFECKTNNSTPPTSPTAGPMKASQPIAPNATLHTNSLVVTLLPNTAGQSRRSA